MFYLVRMCFPLLPLVMCLGETTSLFKDDIGEITGKITRVKLFENRVLRRIFRSQREEVKAKCKQIVEVCLYLRTD